MDRPWSQYFCCMLAGNAEFVRKYPVATKRVTARHPQEPPISAPPTPHVARGASSTGGSPPSYDYAPSGADATLPYDKWRDYDPEDTIRFYAAAPARGRA